MHSDRGTFVRNLLADELVNLAWYDVYGVETPNAIVNDNQLVEVSKSLSSFLSLVANFVNEVIILYCEKYDLVVQGARPHWVSESLTVS